MHIESGKSFVGSARNLSIRFKQYFNYNHLTFPKRNMTIYKALLKYGYAGFRLEILEYCAVEVLSAKLQYYVDKCKPEYNISVPDRSEIIIVKNQIHTSAAQIKVLLGGGGRKYFHSGKPRPIIPTRSYIDAWAQKQAILRDNKNKSGVYR